MVVGQKVESPLLEAETTILCSTRLTRGGRAVDPLGPVLLSEAYVRMMVADTFSASEAPDDPLGPAHR